MSIFRSRLYGGDYGRGRRFLNARGPPATVAVRLNGRPYQLNRYGLQQFLPEILNCCTHNYTRLLPVKDIARTITYRAQRSAPSQGEVQRCLVQLLLRFAQNQMDPSVAIANVDTLLDMAESERPVVDGYGYGRTPGRILTKFETLSAIARAMGSRGIAKSLHGWILSRARQIARGEQAEIVLEWIKAVHRLPDWVTEAEKAQAYQELLKMNNRVIDLVSSGSVYDIPHGLVNTLLRLHDCLYRNRLSRDHGTRCGTHAIMEAQYSPGYGDPFVRPPIRRYGSNTNYLRGPRSTFLDAYDDLVADSSFDDDEEWDDIADDSLLEDDDDDYNSEFDDYADMGRRRNKRFY